MSAARQNISSLTQREAVNWCLDAFFNDLNFNEVMVRVQRLIALKSPEHAMAAQEVLSICGFEGKLTPSKRQIQDAALEFMKTVGELSSRELVLANIAFLKKLGFKIFEYEDQLRFAHISECGGPIVFKTDKIASAS